MRVLFLSNWFPYPPDNGSKIRVYYLLRALAQKHETTLLSFAFDTALHSNTNELHHWCQSVHALPINPFMVNQVGTLQTFLSLHPVASRPIPEMSRMVAKVWQSNVFDVVIASTGMMADYALQTPVDIVKILENHNAMSRWMEERYRTAVVPMQRLRYWVSWQKTRYYEARLFRQFDQVTMVSEQDRQAVEQGLPGRQRPVAVVPNGVDCHHNQPDLYPATTNRLVFNGSLTYHVNYDAIRYFLAEIYPQIKTAVPDITLTITGSTKGVDLTGLELDETVCLTGWVKDVRRPVAEAAVCIVPILEGGGTRLKILEAMALGTPVVATTKGAEGIDAIDGQDILLADNPTAFARQVIDLLCQPERRRKLTTNARQLVENRYDWQEIGRQFVALVEEVAARKRHKLDD